MGLVLRPRAISQQSGIRARAIPRPLVGLAFILAGALVLRILYIDSRGLWGDEAYRVMAARQATIFDTLRAAWAQPPSAPLYWVALHVWVGLFGHRDVVVRLFSVPASVATLVAVYMLGRMVGGTATAMLSALLLAIAPFAIETGQEATMYAWSALFATCTIVAALRWLRTGRGMAAYVISASLLLYTHYIGVLLVLEVLATGLFWWASTRRTTETRASLADWLKGHLTIAVVYSPWAVAMGIRLAQRAGEYSHLKNRATLDQLFGSFNTMGLGASPVAIWPPLQVSVATALGGCLMLLALLLPRAARQRHAIWFLGIISLGCVTAVWLASAITGEWLVQTRLFTLVLPAALVVVAAGVPFGQLRARAAPIGVLTLLLVVGWVFFQVDGVRAFYNNPVHGRDGVREAAAWLNSDRKPGDLVVANNGVLAWFLAQYHDGPIEGLPENADVRNGYTLWPTPDLVNLVPAQWDSLMRLGTDAPRVWLVYLPIMDHQGGFMALMQQNYTLLDHRRYGFADMYLFAKK